MTELSWEEGEKILLVLGGESILGRGEKQDGLWRRDNFTPAPLTNRLGTPQD